MYPANLITNFVNICNIYYVKSLNKYVNWSMLPFPKEHSEKGRRKLYVGHSSHITIIKNKSGSRAMLVQT